MDIFKELTEALGKFLGWKTETIEVITLSLVLVGAAGVIFSFAYKAIKWIALERNKRLVNKNLYPYFTGRDVANATRYYIPTRYQNVNPNEDDEPGRGYIAAAREKLMPLFLKKVFRRGTDEGRLFLLLADGGMGKSTFMINLYLRYSNKFRWFFSPEKYKIALFPLGAKEVLEEVQKIENSKETILLLDALDEDTQAETDYKGRLDEILAASKNFRFVIITCRTQFFPSEIEEPTGSGYFSHGESGEYKFQKLYLSPFRDRDVKRYIRRRFSILRLRTRWKANRIIQKIPQLVARPMLLSHIEALVAMGDQIATASDAYRAMIAFWIKRESNKPFIIQKFGSVEAYEKLLFRFSKEFAQYIFQNRERLRGLSVPKNEILNFFDNPEVSSLFESLEHLSHVEIRSKSLLSRNTKGDYKFSHKSVFEFFLSQILIEDAFSLGEIPSRGFDMLLQFYEELLDQSEYLVSISASISRFDERWDDVVSPARRGLVIALGRTAIKIALGDPFSQMKGIRFRELIAIAPTDNHSLIGLTHMLNFPAILHAFVSLEVEYMGNPLSRFFILGIIADTYNFSGDFVLAGFYLKRMRIDLETLQLGEQDIADMGKMLIDAICNRVLDLESNTGDYNGAHDYLFLMQLMVYLEPESDSILLLRAERQLSHSGAESQLLDSINSIAKKVDTWREHGFELVEQFQILALLTTAVSNNREFDLGRLPAYRIILEALDKFLPPGVGNIMAKNHHTNRVEWVTQEINGVHEFISHILLDLNEIPNEYFSFLFREVLTQWNVRLGDGNFFSTLLPSLEMLFRNSKNSDKLVFLFDNAGLLKYFPDHSKA